MPASANEVLQARVHSVLLYASTAAADRVYRGRPDAFASDEVPAVNVRRSSAQHSAFGSNVDQAVMEFELDLQVRGAEWETSADALHMQCHQALNADVPLRALCKGLRCIRTEPHAEPGDQTLGRITATYQTQALVRVADLTQLTT